MANPPLILTGDQKFYVYFHRPRRRQQNGVSGMETPG